MDSNGIPPTHTQIRLLFFFFFAKHIRPEQVSHQNRLLKPDKDQIFLLMVLLKIYFHLVKGKAVQFMSPNFYSISNANTNSGGLFEQVMIVLLRTAP